MLENGSTLSYDYDVSYVEKLYLTRIKDQGAHEEFIQFTMDLATGERHTTAFLFDTWIITQFAMLYKERPQIIEGTLREECDKRRIRFLIDPLLKKIREQALTLHDPLPPPETLAALSLAQLPDPLSLFPGLLHEGMLLFGGKSKRGKSWMVFDLAIALALGRPAFGHFECPGPQPVLYLALEDGRKRLQMRAKAITPDSQYAENFHLRYTFPALSEGGIAVLAEEIERYHYGLVIIDVLAKLEKPKHGRSEQSYHDVYEMFTPLQELRQSYPFCLAMLTHLRKQEAEDVFENLHGSVAYQGAQDVLWILERKPKDDIALLHLRDKDAEDKSLALKFIDGHWQYVGEGEEFERSTLQRSLLQSLLEEACEMTPKELMKVAGIPEHKYHQVRRALGALVKEDMLHKAEYGKYSATLRAQKEFLAEEDMGIEI